MQKEHQVNKLHTLTLLVLAIGLIAGGATADTIASAVLSNEVAIPALAPESVMLTDGDIYYQLSYSGAGSYDIDSGWYQACLWDTYDISETYALEQISWYGYLYYAQDFDFYIAPSVGGEPGVATYVGSTYDATTGTATWHTHVLSTSYTVLPDTYYYLIMKPLEYTGSGYWWCSNIEVTDPHASMTSTDLVNWTVDYQYGGYEYLGAIWAEGTAGGGGLEVWLADYPATIQLNSTLTFTAGVINNGGSAAVFDEAIMDITGPASISKSLYAGGDISVASGASVSTVVNQMVPGTAPLGIYTITVSIYDDGNFISSDSFNIEVVS